MEAGEGFELVQRTRGLKGLGVEFDARMGRVAAGAAAGRLLGAFGVGAESVPRKNCGLPEIAAATKAWR